MPTESDGLIEGHTLIEYRGIRSGQRAAGKAPVKTPPRIRHTLKAKGSDYFDIDVPLMKSAAKRLGIEDWKTIKELPIRFMSDELYGDNGVMFIERALYSARGRLCGSAMGAVNATQRVDIAAYARSKGKKIEPLNPFVEKECGPACPLWGQDGEKTDCRWRMILTMQLADDPVFPSPVYHRTTSRYSIRSVDTCLRHILSVTNGVLAGPLFWFRQSEIKVRDREGKDRIIPVSTIDYKGTVAELRAEGLRHLQMRNALVEASKGKFVDMGKDLGFMSRGLDDGEIIDDELEDVGDVAGPSGAVEEPRSVEDEAADRMIGVQSQIAALGKKLGYTSARMRALEKKHEGDLQSILEELRAEDPQTDFDPSPGTPADETADVANDTEPETVDTEPEPVAAVAAGDDDIDDLFDD